MSLADHGYEVLTRDRCRTVWARRPRCGLDDCDAPMVTVSWAAITIDVPNDRLGMVESKTVGHRFEWSCERGHVALRTEMLR